MSAGVPVLHVVEAMHTGGAESMVVELARGAGAPYRVLVCALNRGGPALEAAEAAGARTWTLEKRGVRLDALLGLASLMRREGVRVVHGHNPTGSLYAMLAAALAGVPVRVRTEHSLRYPGRHSFLYPVLERLVNALAHRVVCVCDAVRESHRRGGVPARKLVVVENGVPAAPAVRARGEVRVELGEHPDIPVALAVGSLTPQKAHEVLIEAFAAVRAAVPGARLWIAGEGRRRDWLEGRARALGLGDVVRFLGARADVADLMQAADVFVLCSRREGLSITLLEAMRAGRACLVSDAGGSAEAVARGSAGRVVPSGDAAALAAELAGLLADPEARLRLGAAAERRWRERYTAARMVAGTEELYRSLLAGIPERRRAAGEVGDGRVVA